MEGEEIAVNGTFSIDAAAQLAGKPSMMSPEGGQVMTGHNHGEMDVGGNENQKEEHEIKPKAAVSKSLSVDDQAKKDFTTFIYRLPEMERCPGQR